MVTVFCPTSISLNLKNMSVLQKELIFQSWFVLLIKNMTVMSPYYLGEYFSYLLFSMEVIL